MLLILLQGLAFVLDFFQVKDLSKQTLKRHWFVDAPPQLPWLNAARPHCREKLGLQYLQKQILQWLGLQNQFFQGNTQ